MKFNDPFGRMERRHQAGYEAMRDSLRRGNITSPEAAREIIRQSQKRVMNILGVIVVLLLLVILLLPKATPLAVCFALLAAVWLFNSTVNGKQYIERYIDEELK